MEPKRVLSENLARIRTDRKITKAALADQAGIARMTIGKIERGQVVPRSATLSALAKALKVPLRDLVTPVEPLRNARFRSRKRANSREQILAEVSGWLQSYSWLESELEDRQEFILSDLRDLNLPANELAAKAREKLCLKPKDAIRDICGLLEDNGIKMLLLKKNTDAFFGLSVASEKYGPAIVVNTWKRISVERWIFTAAHELGHLLLHRDAYDSSKDDEPENEEREADRFASNFLMPEAGFASEWDDSRGLSLIHRVFKIKRIFKVSYKTVLYRLVESGRESSDIWKTFQLQHKLHFGHTLKKVDEPDKLDQGEFRLDWNCAGEPESLSSSDFLQDRLHRLVRLVLEKNIITLSRAAVILGLSHYDMRDLAASWGR